MPIPTFPLTHPHLCKPDMVYTLNRAHGLHIIGYLHAIDQWG